MLQNQVQDDGKSCGEGLVNLDKKLIVIYLWLLSDFERFLEKNNDFEKYQKMYLYSPCT